MEKDFVPAQSLCPCYDIKPRPTIDVSLVLRKSFQLKNRMPTGCSKFFRLADTVVMPGLAYAQANYRQATQDKPLIGISDLVGHALPAHMTLSDLCALESNFDDLDFDLQVWFSKNKLCAFAGARICSKRGTVMVPVTEYTAPSQHNHSASLSVVFHPLYNPVPGENFFAGFLG